TGTLGALTARHLITHHGARHLHLTSRTGPNAQNAAQLEAELTALGAHITITATDTSNPHDLTTLLTRIPDQHPLTAVIHTAGTLDDAVVTELTEAHVDRVFGPKVDGAVILDELTRHADLSAFVLFSSAAATVGAAGQANYAAANAFLDALAQRRRRAGLPAVSMAWGLWEQRSGMTAHLDGADLGRMARGGMVPLTAQDGLALFDQALSGAEPVVVPARLDLAALRERAESGTLPAVLGSVLRTPLPRVAAAGGAAPADSWERRLLALPPGEREGALLDLVRGHAAAVLGHATPDTVDAARLFKESGFDSLTAVEFRNRLVAATGLRLPATLVFDHPTPEALARHLHGELLPDEPAAADAALTELAGVEAVLSGAAEADDDVRQEIVQRLEDLVALWGRLRRPEGEPATGRPIDSQRIAEASPEEIFALIDNGLGRATGR
ncbi:SDR family NAD(P)-dependent oxidoreductase, partial [Kitasatospora sp. NPDC001132]